MLKSLNSSKTKTRKIQRENNQGLLNNKYTRNNKSV